MSVISRFEHHQAAHCESGVTSNLLLNAGLPVSEAMAFGIGSGLFFAHLPFVKVMELPLTSYRSLPGGIFKKTCDRLGIPYTYQTFRDPVQARHALDELASAQRAVGLRSNIYWLPYIPEQFRFQFNAHNLVVYGRDDDGDYLVSDPVMETAARCPTQALTKGRFAKGALAPKGLIFYPEVAATSGLDERWARAIRTGIQETVNRNLYAPIFFGVQGITFLSRRMRKWPKLLKDSGAVKLNLANVVRMQEEIGTGGAGFRFLYAAFLQEASGRLNRPELARASRDLTEAGNAWREFATKAAKFCKDRLDGSYDSIPDLLVDIAARERSIYRDLRRSYLSSGH